MLTIPVPTLGEIVLRRRTELGLTQAALGAKIGVEGKTIANLERGRTKTLKTSNLQRLPGALGLPAEQIIPLAILGVIGSEEEIPFGNGEKAKEGGSEKPYTPIKESDVTAVKGGKTTVPEYPGVSAVRKDYRSDDQAKRAELSPGLEGDFVVQLDGQCMEPEYPDRRRVLFSVERWKSEGFVDGKDYWIRFEDGDSTFKRVRIDKANAHELILAPLNPGVKPWTVKRRTVSLAARAVALLID